MAQEFVISKSERVYLRELAKKYLEYANLPVMEDRKKLWYLHNSSKGTRPMVVMEHATFEDDILPESKCVSESAKEIERYLMSAIIDFKLIDDDKVIPPYFELFWKIDINGYGVEVKRKFAEDAHGRKLGFSVEHPIKDLKRDLHKIKPSTFHVDREYTFAWKCFVEETIGDIVPVIIKNASLFWHIAPSVRIVELMGLENMMLSMVDYSDELNALYKFIKEDMEAFIRWQEREGLLVLNNGNDYVGAGSYGFTDELPSNEYKDGGPVLSRDL